MNTTRNKLIIFSSYQGDQTASQACDWLSPLSLLVARYSSQQLVVVVVVIVVVVALFRMHASLVQELMLRILDADV